MTSIVPRLHSEFFDIVRHLEDIFRHKAKLSEQAFRPILAEAIECYLNDTRSTFREYLHEELRRRPIIYNSITKDVLAELLKEDKTSSSRSI